MGMAGDFSMIPPKVAQAGDIRQPHSGAGALAKIVDTLHAGRSHACPGSVERTCDINRPTAGLDDHGGKAKPARVYGRVVDTEVGREPYQEDSLQTALAQIACQTGRRRSIVL
jgi:hypothetical protein